MSLCAGHVRECIFFFAAQTHMIRQLNVCHCNGIHHASTSQAGKCLYGHWFFLHSFHLVEETTADMYAKRVGILFYNRFVRVFIYVLPFNFRFRFLLLSVFLQ